MKVLDATTGKGQVRHSASTELDSAVQDWGAKIFSLVDSAPPPTLFSRSGLHHALMDWAMRDEQFKTQLFRFIDVLPMLSSSSEVARHLREYLGSDESSAPTALRLGLKAASSASWLFGSGVKSQVTSMARQFMIADAPREVIAALKELHRQDIAFTLDLLGETVVSEAEADHYAARYLELMSVLGGEGDWLRGCRSNVSSRGEVPPLNFSVKISALYSQIHPTDLATAIERISSRLRPILRKASAMGAFVNFDMESYALKGLTLALFKTIFSEPEFAREPAGGLALQAYLKDSASDLAELISWAEQRRRRITIRLVKGAYWDYETVVARQKGWPVPVCERKPETDANFEELSRLLLEHEGVIEAAFGTHNVRSIAHVLAQGERLNLDPRSFEFQMLRGMAEPIKSALLQLNCRVREYCAVGDLLPGMAYLVRRLLENTSNEGFLANRFVRGASREELLKSPQQATMPPAISGRADGEHVGVFVNEPPTDFTLQESRDSLEDAIAALRHELGERQPLLIDHRPVRTRDWLPSLNPANQQEIIGYAAQATVAEADLAVAAARRAQPVWGGTPASQRAALLEKLATLLRRDKQRLCALEILEAGKQWTEADADVAEAIDFCDFYAAQTRLLGKPLRTQFVPGESNVQHWLPRGVGVIIAPWNFPLAILTGMTAAAVVSGNAVIVKPSDDSPVIAAHLVKLMVEAGFPAGVVNLLTGPGETVGAHLVAHPQVDLIAFTGSKEVGLRIWETAARTPVGQRNLKKVICEMGGKNCVIVDSDADLDEAVAGCLVSAFGYQGQKCSALSRLVVLARIYERFMERFLAAASSMRIGPAEAPGHTIGPVINRRAQERILSVIAGARKEATLAWQGLVPEVPEACYVPPTVFTNVPSTSALFRQEIFGPVVAVTKADDFDHALALANDSEFALTGGCYSRSPHHIERVKAEFVCGNLYVNRPITGALVERQPFGGFKMSGGGTKAGGPEYLQNFLIPRVVTENCLRRGFAPEEAGP